MEWLQADANDNGYSHLSDVEIISQVMSPHSLDTDDDTETVVEPEVEPPCPLIPHRHAVKLFDSCIAWLQQQDEATVVCTTYPC